MYPEFSRAFWAYTLAFQRALLNFQGLRARGPFLFETLVVCYVLTLRHPFLRPFLFHSRHLPIQVLFQLHRLHLNFFSNILHFQAQVSPILAEFQPLRHTFEQWFVPKTLVPAKKHVPETLLLKAWVTHTYQFFLVPPPPPPPEMSDNVTWTSESEMYIASLWPQMTISFLKCWQRTCNL